MSSAPSNAISDFLNKGGKVVKVQDAIPVSGPDVVDYLMSCGISARYSPGDQRAYVCRGKRLSLSKLVELANGYRSSQNLPPFAARVNLFLGRTQA